MKLFGSELAHKPTPAEQIASLTDSIKGVPVELKNPILLYSYVIPDGIGDLILQMRTYHELNKRYPGMVQCVTCCEPENMEIVQNLVKEHQFPTEVNLFEPFRLKFERGYNHDNDPGFESGFAPDFDADFPPPSRLQFPFKPESYDLIMVVSFSNKAPTAFYNYRNIYYLVEMNDMTRSIGKDLDLRSKQNSISFYPAGEGIWHDNIKVVDPRGEDYLQASERLNNVYHCPNFNDATETKHWFDHSWIAQSHCYNLDFFMTSLLAQAGYVNQHKPETERIIIKANLKDRTGKPWPDLRKYFQQDPIKSELSRRGIGSIQIDGETISIDPAQSRTIQITSAKIPQEDYPLFQSTINGVSIPGGDNTCSEAFSNKNTLLPPFPEMRLIKHDVLKDLIEVCDTLLLSKEQVDWLKKIYGLCLQINEFREDALADSVPISPEQMVAWSKQLESCWLESNVPKETWDILSNHIQKHSLNERIEGLVKEQICMKRDPNLLKEKRKLLETDNNMETKKSEYCKLVTQSNVKHLDENNGPENPPPTAKHL